MKMRTIRIVATTVRLAASGWPIGRPPSVAPLVETTVYDGVRNGTAEPGGSFALQSRIATPKEPYWSTWLLRLEARPGVWYVKVRPPSGRRDALSRPPSDPRPTESRPT